QLGSQNAKIIVQNNSSKSVVAADFACLLAFPVDPYLQWDRNYQRIQANNPGEELPKLNASELLLVALVNYSADPSVIPAGEVRVVEFSFSTSNLSMPEDWQQPFENRCLTPGNGTLTTHELIPVEWSFYFTFGLHDLISKSSHSPNWNVPEEKLSEVAAVYGDIP
ncbi:MAG: hypothetical protein ABI459_05155, partial [Deltaproteobacteria bacterium]